MAASAIERLAVSHLVRVWGMDAKGKPFIQKAHAIDISPKGFTLRGLSGVPVGEIIGIQCNQAKGRFRVMWAGEPGSDRENCLGVEPLEQQTMWAFPFHISMNKSADEFGVVSPVVPGDFQPAVIGHQDSLKAGTNSGTNKKPPHPVLMKRITNAMITGVNASTSDYNRRIFERYKCKGSVTVHSELEPVALHAELTDISLGGCYMDLLTPLPLDSRVDLTIEVLKQTLIVQGRVRTSHQRMGMGIEFSGTTEDSRSVLKRILTILQAEQSSKTKKPLDELKPTSIAAPEASAESQRLEQAAEIATKSSNAARGTESLSKLEQLLKASMALHVLQMLVTGQDVDFRLHVEFREATEHARNVMTMVHQWIELKQNGSDPFVVLHAMTEERLRSAAKVNRHVADDLDALEITHTTQGFDAMKHAVQNLGRRIER